MAFTLDDTMLPARLTFHPMTDDCLINPDDRSVEIYRPNREPELRTGIESIGGEGPMQGFTLDLRSMWDPLARSNR